MSDATARPWGWSREKETGDIVIHGPPYPENNDTCDIVLADGEYLSEEEAAGIVRDHNAHDALVKGLEYVVLKAACGASSHELSQAAQAVLEEVKL